MKFGDYLRNCRDKLEWTQPEAASKIEIEQSYLSKLETGKSYPSEEIFDKLVEVYQIKIEELYEKISSEELVRLKELKQVRSAIIKKDHAKVTTTRGWLVAGFIMMMLGGTFLGIAIIPNHASMEYLYRSQGVLHPDEPLDQFSLIELQLDDVPENKNQITKQKELLTRLDQMDEVTGQDKGSAFVKTTLKGRRLFEKMSHREISSRHTNRWLLAPALMLIFGAFSCFYISRRWN
ncbi:helix-turn-helix domain-containing protein [Aliikangiella sp. G2MR2-5]|uniref:helix-turn-helix domain-containing protein n=1 Tax=Aliikangiella sp. G2MR2-5 TaxID=2788943 RepID=UPI0018A9AC8F|nr:helix-turn-helix transcriptional regulator [Aliikangiella sp. G2MR2-5]